PHLSPLSLHDALPIFLYSIGVTGFIYPIIGHWSWGPDGWLATMQPLGFRDFAGSTVVHTIGGAISLVGAIALGPRLGRIFKRNGDRKSTRLNSSHLGI